jgi:nucleoside 2-deoxyribosyltransferase
MKFYVAGSYHFRTDIDRLVDQIQQSLPEFECTSTWLRQGEEDDELEKHGHQHFIDLDFKDIARADAVLMINDFALSKASTGRWVELGIALEQRKLCVVFGWAQDSLFLKDRFVVYVDSISPTDLIKVLETVIKTHYWLEHKDDDELELRRVRLYANREGRSASGQQIGPGENPLPVGHTSGSEDPGAGLPHREGQVEYGPSGGVIYRDQSAVRGETRPGGADSSTDFPEG